MSIIYSSTSTAYSSECPTRKVGIKSTKILMTICAKIKKQIEGRFFLLFKVIVQGLIELFYLNS